MRQQVSQLMLQNQQLTKANHDLMIKNQELLSSQEGQMQQMAQMQATLSMVQQKQDRRKFKYEM